MVNYLCDKGRYNFCSNEEQWKLALFLPDKKLISETFDDHPGINSDMLPSEILEVISERLESYWMSSSREEKRKIIQHWRENKAELDMPWLENKINEAQDKVLRFQKQLDEYKEELIDGELQKN